MILNPSPVHAEHLVASPKRFFTVPNVVVVVECMLSLIIIILTVVLRVFVCDLSHLLYVHARVFTLHFACVFSFSMSLICCT